MSLQDLKQANQEMLILLQKMIKQNLEHENEVNTKRQPSYKHKVDVLEVDTTGIAADMNARLKDRKRKLAESRSAVESRIREMESSNSTSNSRPPPPKYEGLDSPKSFDSNGRHSSGPAVSESEVMPKPKGPPVIGPVFIGQKKAKSASSASGAVGPPVIGGIDKIQLKTSMKKTVSKMEVKLPIGNYKGAVTGTPVPITFNRCRLCLKTNSSNDKNWKSKYDLQFEILATLAIVIQPEHEKAANFDQINGICPKCHEHLSTQMIYMNMMIKLKTKEVLFSGPEMEFGVVLRKLIDLMRDAGFKTWFDGEVEKFKKKLCSDGK